MTRHRALAVTIAAGYMEILHSVEGFHAILEATEPDILAEFIDGMEDVAEGILRLHFPDHESNGWHR